MMAILMLVSVHIRMTNDVAEDSEYYYYPYNVDTFVKYSMFCAKDL